MDIKFDLEDSVPVLELHGRLDGYGASLFDETVRSFGEGVREVVIDLSSVDYISSSGIRSLLKLDKSLRRKGGRFILVKPSAFVAQVLESAGLMQQFMTAESVAEALRSARGAESSDGARRIHRTSGGREYAVASLPEAPCALDLWGSFTDLAGRLATPQRLAAASIRDLGPCFGIGGFGASRLQASQSMGEFLSAGGMAGVVPADGHCVADVLIAREHVETMIHPAAAIGFSGSPAFVFDLLGEGAVSVAELAVDLVRAVEELQGRVPPALGFVVLSRLRKLSGSFFRESEDMPGNRPEKGSGLAAEGLLMVSAAVDASVPAAAQDPAFSDFREQMKAYPIQEGVHFHGHAVALSSLEPLTDDRELERNLGGLANLEVLEAVVHVEPETELVNPRVWVFAPQTARRGREKLLKVEVVGEGEFLEEWDAIARRIYADAGRVVLTPLHGGYMSATFQATSYDREGRKMLPTVLKIGPVALTRREEQAHRNYVEKYILNNSTSIMGTATSGKWAGLRYNFIGITGPESSISWLRDRYLTRPLEELKPLFDAIFTKVLKPWYGQPRWETIHPYEEHDPQRLFPNIAADAERELGISPEAETIRCEELGIDLLNPYRFLKHEYPRRRGAPFSWYRSIAHGDLNLQNILLDEKENIYVIDFSETRVRSVVSDFARLEPILKFETTRLNDETDLRDLLELELGLAEPAAISDKPPCRYRGTDPMAEKAHGIICLLRGYANKATIFEENIVPYLLALLEWTYPVVSFRSAGPLVKRLSAYSAAILCKRIMELS